MLPCKTVQHLAILMKFARWSFVELANCLEAVCQCTGRHLAEHEQLTEKKGKAWKYFVVFKIRAYLLLF